MTEIEIGRAKRGRRAYSFDDIAIVPSRRTRDPEEVSTAWQIDAYRFDIPVLAAPMDSVMSPSTAIALGQIIQLPVASVATIGNYASGSVDLMAAAAIGLVLMPGVVAGRWTVEMIPVALVTRIVAVLLVAAGFWLAWNMV